MVTAVVTAKGAAVECLGDDPPAGAAKSTGKRLAKIPGRMSAPPTVVLLSYVPLLAGQPGELLPTGRRQEVLRALKRAPAVRGLLWAEANEGAVPVFLVERGRDVVEHLRAWAERVPSHWFYLYIAQTADRWHVMLAPNLRHSISRYREARWLLHRETVPPDAKFEVVYRPLYWSHPPDVARDVVVRRLMRAGILDWTEVDPNDLDRTPDPEYLGPFIVNPADQPLHEDFGNRALRGKSGGDPGGF